MTEKFDDDVFVAYVDGELSDQQSRDVEQFLMADENARNFVDDLRALDRDLREEADDVAFSGGLDELKSRLVVIGGKPESRSGRGIDWGQAVPIAATIVAMFVGVALGYLTANTRFENQLAALETTRLEDQRMLHAAISDALEKVASGQVVNWQSQTSSTKVRLTPIRTFKANDGSWCREYESVKIFDSQEERTHAIACRKGKADWQTRIITIDG